METLGGRHDACLWNVFSESFGLMRRLRTLKALGAGYAVTLPIVGIALWRDAPHFIYPMMGLAGFLITMVYMDKNP